jgi:GNAT superfamily N-acetyltransferase
VDVRALTGDEWRLKRELRLAALKDSPDAFASSYAREAHRTEADWRTWPAGGAFFAAFAPAFAPSAALPVGEPLGIVGTWVAAADPRTTHLISMWVAPVARGRGVAAALVDAVVGWARDRDHHTVELEVAGGNAPAMSAYLRCGFIVTEREPFTTGGTVLIRPVK